jgi:hypothetical protein
MSSSGCERNWSTFTLVHTKLRNWLSYDKLHKLVYVRYNLKVCIEHYETDMESLEQMKNSKYRNNQPLSVQDKKRQKKLSIKGLYMLEKVKYI